LVGDHVLGSIHVHSLWSQVEHKGGLEFTPMLRPWRALQEVSYFQGVKIDHSGAGGGGHGHEQSIQVELEPMGGEEDEFLNPVVFPLGQELVQCSVEGLSLETRRSGKCSLIRSRHPEVEGGSAEDLHFLRDGLGHGFCYEGIRTQGEVASVLNQGSHWKEEPWVPGEGFFHLRPWEGVQRP
jgi:hypothetical protein